jgi:hypothetical protein
MTKFRMMGWAVCVACMNNMKNIYKILVRSFWKKTTLKADFTLYLTLIENEAVDCIHLAQDWSNIEVLCTW